MGISTLFDLYSTRRLSQRRHEVSDDSPSEMTPRRIMVIFASMWSARSSSAIVQQMGGGGGGGDGSGWAGRGSNPKNSSSLILMYRDKGTYHRQGYYVTETKTSEETTRTWCETAVSAFFTETHNKNTKSWHYNPSEGAAFKPKSIAPMKHPCSTPAAPLPRVNFRACLCVLFFGTVMNGAVEATVVNNCQNHSKKLLFVLWLKG